jgi:hypothetical protein
MRPDQEARIYPGERGHASLRDRSLVPVVAHLGHVAPSVTQDAENH